MAAARKYLIERLRLWGCGLHATEGLSDQEKLLLHKFKTQVAELGEQLYSEMPPAKADAFIVKAVFGVIEDELRSREH